MTSAPSPHAPGLRINLIARDNGAGLSRDLTVLRDALETLPRVEVHVTALGRRSSVRERARRLGARVRDARGGPRPAPFDLNVMLEHVRPECLSLARRNVLIPNPEYVDAADLAALPDLHAVWVKTHHAEELFAQRGTPVHYVGFSSVDRLDEAVTREAGFFHGPGRSAHKGTQALLDLWREHPEWPQLTVIWRRKRIDAGDLPPNVRLIRKHLDDAAYRRLQNAHRFHLCPSRTEGFGHYLVEAMSCRAVVVTLDAAPMNELIAPGRGLLVAAQAAGRRELATLYACPPEAMERAVEDCLTLSEIEITRMGEAARAWYEAARSRLARRLAKALAAVFSREYGT